MIPSMIWWQHYDHFTVLFRSESTEKLDVLAKKLQSVQDVDELTKMVLRGGKKKGWNVLTLLTGPVLISLFLWSSALPASSRKGRWFVQPSERSEMSSSKASPAVWWSLAFCPDVAPFHWFDKQQLFVKCGVFFSPCSGIVIADSKQADLCIRKAIITEL